MRASYGRALSHFAEGCGTSLKPRRVCQRAIVTRLNELGIGETKGGSWSLAQGCLAGSLTKLVRAGDDRIGCCRPLAAGRSSTEQSFNDSICRPS